MLSGAGASIAAACAPARRARKDLVVWHAYRGREADAFAKIIQHYNDALPKDAARVRAVAVPFDAFADKISAAIPQGKGPDVFIFAHERLGGWVEGGRTIAPIGFWLDAQKRKEFLPGLLDAVTYREEVYGLPLNYKSIALIYNKAMIAQAPDTSSALVRMAQEHTQAARGRYGIAYPYDDFFYHAALQNGFGGGVFDAKGAPILDHPGNLAASALLLKWKNDAPTMPADASGALIQTLFNQRRAAMVLSGPWFIGEAAKDIDLGVAPLPRLDESAGAPIRPWMTVEAAFITKQSPRQEEAFAFAAHLSGETAGAIMTSEGGQLHANRAVYALDSVKKDAIAQGFRRQMETAIAMPNKPEMTLVWSPADVALKRVVKGEASPAAAWRDAQATLVDSIAALHRSQS
jgi:arabinogalactan oligomer/maltooligosaccharide transport system substrate-binding protein